MTPFFIRKSSYVIIEGFTATKAVNAGQAFYLGGAGFGTGGINGLVDPVHHVTVRHSTATYNGGPNTWRGAFYIQGPSHEVLFDHVEAHHGGTGAEYGVPHSLTNTLLPYNIWTQYLYSHHNVNGGGNGGGILLMGARNSIVSHAVLSYSSDGGGGTQGPFADDNVFEHITTFGHDQTLSPSGVDGNERGIQMGNVNNNLALNPPYPSGGRDGVFHHIIAYDNMGNGVNDAQGSHNGQYLHMSVFNNTRHGATRSVPGVWSGLGFESEGGTGNYPGVTIPATLTNTLSFHNIVGGIPADGAIRANTIQDTNLLSLDPAFSTGTPAPGAASTLTSDTALYTDAPRRTPNPNFGVVAGLMLRAGSPAIDRGTFVAGFHCDRADDAPVPYPANDPNCVHWRGAAPDIGAYEYGGSQVSSPPAAPTGLQVR